MIKLKRAYVPAAPEDGVRVLVERLWPRGLTKAALRLDAWLKDVAPSDALRRWFAHDPRKWAAFRRRYVKELASRSEAVAQLRAAARRGTVTLVYSTRDEKHNNAVALRAYLRARRAGQTGRRRRSTHP